MKTSSKIYTALIMLFLFAPIAILLVFSFNESKSLSVFSNFSLYWYKELLRDSETLNAVKNTLLLALANLPRTVLFGLFNTAAILLCGRFVVPLFFLPALTALLSTLAVEPMFRPFLEPESSEPEA